MGASAQDWTCEECEEGGHAAAAFLSTEEGITTQTQILVTDTCPEHPDPDYCGEHMPEWWGAIGPIVWHEHFEYICDDLDWVSGAAPSPPSPTPSPPLSPPPGTGSPCSAPSGAPDLLKTLT